jgi:hypothetical protein
MMYIAQDLRILIQATLVTFKTKNLLACRVIHLEASHLVEFLLGVILLEDCLLKGACLLGEFVPGAFPLYII